MPVPQSLEHAAGRFLVATVALSFVWSTRLAAQEEPSRWLGRIRFAGHDVVSERELRSLVTIRAGKRFTPADLDESVGAITRRYHEDGFLLASVVAKPEPSVADSVPVTFEIHEGRRFTIATVTLLGAEAVPAAEALRALDMLKPRRLGGVVSRGYYVPHRLDADLARLLAFYRDLGHVQAIVSLEELVLDTASRTVGVVLRVREGPRWIVGSVQVTGNELFPDRLLLREANVRTGEPFSGSAANEGVRRIARWYQERAEIVPDVGMYLLLGDDDHLTVVYEVAEREHILTGTLEFSGNERTREVVLRERATLTPGGPFTRLELEETQRRIAALGLFERVEIVSTESDRPGARDVEVRVVEQEHWGWIEAGGGAWSGGGELAYLGIRHSNVDLFRLPRRWDDWRGAFTGAGQKLELQFAPGTRESNYRVRFEEPTFLRSDVSFVARAGAGLFERRSYDESHTETAFELRKYFDRDRELSLALGYLLDRVRISDLDDDAPQDAVDARGTTFLAYPRLELRFDDTVENYFAGPTGLRAVARLDLADGVTGSEEDFVRGQVRADFFLPLFARNPDFRHTLQIGVDLGGIGALDGDGVPLYERFYTGGPYTFRGFAYRRLGPHDGSTPIGGEGLLQGTVQYSLPLFWREVRAAAVFDWGDNARSFSSISTGRFRTAIGGGLQLRLHLAGQPIPANLYWVEALASEPEDREQLFTFSLGFSF